MTTSRLRLRYLFDCYYNKTATPQEREELFAAINAGSTDEELSCLIRQAWDDLKPGLLLFNNQQTNNMLSNILNADTSIKNKQPNNNNLLWAKIATAAVVLFFVSFGTYRYFKLQKSATKRQVVKVKRPTNDALPGGNKAILTLANGKTIILDNAQNGTLAKEGSTFVKKAANGQLIYNVANTSSANTLPVTNTIATPRGGQYQIVLADGTRVWLNSSSSLQFPTRFTGTSRQVEITGEAYFEVTKNAAMPFRVKTNRAEIEVLGTHFNVMAYDDESTMKTTLLEGAVNITSGSFSARLKPGQQAQIRSSGQNKVIDDVDVEDEVAWKNGIFQFRDAGVDVIMRQAARWYDLDITYGAKLPEKQFTGRISRNVKASLLFEMLKYSGINLKIEGNKIIVL